MAVADESYFGEVRDAYQPAKMSFVVPLAVLSNLVVLWSWQRLAERDCANLAVVALSELLDTPRTESVYPQFHLKCENFFHSVGR